LAEAACAFPFHGAEGAHVRSGKPLNGRRILLVEDEYMIAEIVEEWLHQAGAEVVGPVPSVEQALACLNERNALDGAVLDVNLSPVKPHNRLPTS
jgi:CheY-like chemotaxis protein